MIGTPINVLFIIVKTRFFETFHAQYLFHYAILFINIWKE